MNKLKNLNKKNRRGQLGKLGIIISLFVFIVLGIVFAEAIADNQSKMTDKNSVDDETFNLTSNGCYASGEVDESNPDCNLTVSNWYDSDDWKSSYSGCYLSGVTVSDDTDTALTEDTDYVLYESKGIIQMLDTSDTTQSDSGDDTLVDYEYCPYGYVKDDGARSVTTLILLFFVLAIFVAVATNPSLREWFQGNVLGR